MDVPNEGDELRTGELHCFSQGAAFVAVMIMVAIGTFPWKSILGLKRHPRTSSIVMLATVATALATQDLSNGRRSGALVSGVFFAGKIARLLSVGKRFFIDVSGCRHASPTVPVDKRKALLVFCPWNKSYFVKAGGPHFPRMGVATCPSPVSQKPSVLAIACMNLVWERR